MKADVIIGGLVRVYNFAQARMLGGALVGRIDAVVGSTVQIELHEPPPGPLRWSADNDEVLEIADDGGTTATIRAAHPGDSNLEIIQRGRVVMSILFGVTPERAAQLAPSVGEPVQK